MLCFCCGVKCFIAAVAGGRRRQCVREQLDLCTSKSGCVYAMEAAQLCTERGANRITCMCRGLLSQHGANCAWPANDSLLRVAIGSKEDFTFGVRCTLLQ